MRPSERGVALITVILILLVLTVLGIAAALLMTQEDRTSARQELYKEALYVAEVGLRAGETTLGTVSSAGATGMLQYDPVATGALREIWRDSTTDQLPRHPACGPLQNWNSTNLGTYFSPSGTGAPIVNVEVPVSVAGGSAATGRRAFYSLYVRNNPDDPNMCAQVSPAVQLDQDQIVRLVSVGWVSNADGRPLAVKIVEEEFNFEGVSQNPSGQKQVNQGGTGQAIL